MMWRAIVFLWVALFSSLTLAGQTCTVTPSDDFIISAAIMDYDPDVTYQIYVEKANKNTLLWSNRDTNAYIQDNSLVEGQNYHLRFMFEALVHQGNDVEGITYYYRKLASKNSWQLIGEQEVTLHSGANSLITFEQGELDCQNYDVVTPVDYCTYFPEPAQSWKSGSALLMQNDNQQITGWSDNYVKANLVQSIDTSGDGAADSISASSCNLADDNCALKTGFDSVDWPGRKYSNMACENGVCFTGGQKIAIPEPVDVDFSSLPAVNLDIDQYKDMDTVCDGTYCGYSYDSVNKVYEVVIHHSVQALTVNAWGDASFHIVFATEATDLDYGLKIQKVSIGGNTDKLSSTFRGDGYFTFGEVTLTAGHIEFEGEVVINLTTSWNVTNPFEFIDHNGSAFIYGPDASVIFAGDGQQLRMNILADSLSFQNGNLYMAGSVTANRLVMTNPNTYIHAEQGSCSNNPPTATSYQLDITPAAQHSLLCQTPQVTMTIYDDSGNIATGYTGNINLSLPSGLAVTQTTTGSYQGNGIFTPSSGKVVFNVGSSRLSEYSFSGQLSSDSGVTDSAKVLFVPYQFASSANPIQAIAGHDTDVELQVLACKNDTATVVQGYSGHKTLTVSGPNLTQPTIAQDAVAGRLAVAGSDSDSIALDFSSSAKASTSVNYDQSGSLYFELSDDGFVCPAEYQGCENQDGNTVITPLKGLINLDVRPWTFALCEPNNETMDGSANSGSGFKAAGEEFALQVKPIVWQSGGSVTGAIETSGYCNAAVTSNFFINEAPAATIELTSQLETPSNGRLGNGIEAATSLQRLHDQKHDPIDDSKPVEPYYLYNLSWQEVGSVQVQADSQADYLSMDINQGYRNIGRFYPHHLAHISNSWHYALNHNGFAYMNQPIEIEYVVEAQNTDGQATWNYGLFDKALQSEFAERAVAQNNNELSSRILFTPQSEDGWSDSLPLSQRNAQYVVNSNDFTLLKVPVATTSIDGPYTTRADGPYDASNAKFGVTVIDTKQDDVNFDITAIEESTNPQQLIKINGEIVGLAFINQPDFRYGRMHLDSVSGASGTLVQIPLRVEYWQSANDSWVTNSDDNGSQFITSQYCVLSSVAESDAYLTDTDTNNSNVVQTVTAGVSSIVRAGQQTAGRELVRLFLRQGVTEPDGVRDCHWSMTGSQPWLQYNWRIDASGKPLGDEDPSSLVSFGSYRGNDRVIYRGEPNLINH